MRNSVEYDGMCYCCPGKRDIEKMDYMNDNIKFFDRTEFGAGWWPLSDKESRIRYFDWLIERYSDPNPNGV